MVFGLKGFEVPANQQPKIELRKGRKSEFDGCQYYNLIPSAKNFLQQNGMDLDLMLRQENLLCLKPALISRNTLESFCTMGLGQPSL